jgi:hypothetical protein
MANDKDSLNHFLIPLLASEINYTMFKLLDDVVAKAKQQAIDYIN